MLSLHPQRGKCRLTNNLLPTSSGGLASRPGASQVLSGDIAKAHPWGNRVLFEKQGRIALWDGVSEIDISAAGHALQATPFQALTSDAKREDRLYVGDGVNPLWYVARRSGAFARYDIANKLLGPSGMSYPVPVPTAVGTWRGRVWTASGTNRIQHCQFDDPDYWDPLWTPEFQGKKADIVVAMQPHGEDTMYVGGQHGMWTIKGDSQYNWKREQYSDAGVIGPNAIDGSYWAAPEGLHQVGTTEPISEDLKNIFASPKYPGHVVIDARRQLLLLLVGGRLFAMHLQQPGKFGEIVCSGVVRGLIALDDYTGWYGTEGLWMLGARDTADRALEGTMTAVNSLFDTWDEIPNVNGNGRALLKTSKLVVGGSARGNVTYTVTAESDEDVDQETMSASLTDTTPEVWSDEIAGLDGEDWPTPVVRREFPVGIAGTRFRHQLSAPCHMELHAFVPEYKFGKEKKE